MGHGWSAFHPRLRRSGRSPARLQALPSGLNSHSLTYTRELAFRSALILLLAAGFLKAATSGEAVYKQRCAACHEAPDSRAPNPEAMRKMSAARILHTIDFGVMMSVTYMLTRGEREAIATYLGTATDNRA